jgi:outer membrane protein insertion porin family
MVACAAKPAAAPEPPTVNEISFARPTEYGGKRYKRLRVELSGATQLRAVEIARDLRVMFGSVEPDVLAYDRLIIAAWYYDHGYVTVKVDDVVSTHGDEVIVTFTVREGNAFRIRAIDVFEEVDGKRVAPLGWKNKVRAGDLFQRAVVATALMDIRRAYRDLGYAYVEADPITELHPDSHQLSLRVPITRGPIAYFEKIDVSGNVKVPADAIRKEVLVHIGEPYNETKLEQTKKNLETSAWFETVAIATVPGTSKDKIVVSVEVKERASTSFGEIASLAPR